ncbi:hypothetical protein GCM10007973_01400 [Polymorphobacter multimanifer]|uniref:Oxidoreductase molybdopterin-binding domain-containing protein n=1 Tax=Polymorphobacter multimanifer TaxID=1070431 RepID=A0A841L984_9SPHN|nr:molybdopterin-dependent oxidoreductase [Polymorphobacter multimanifer]MBB6226395.1 hypothetical protein [Polymorphobacter multimanifer]GGI67992.1 hypothetical protein GCM10007973_01400 [Polymorphobacter multimanifer]
MWRIMVAGLAAMMAAPVAALGVGPATPVPLAVDGLARQTLAWMDHGKARTCEGVWLRDVLAKAGAPAGEALRGDALRMMVLVEAADGYRVVFSLGELDAKLGNAQLLLADACDGTPLDEADGPHRLVAAGEARGARSVRQVTRILLVPLTD